MNIIKTICTVTENIIYDGKKSTRGTISYSINNHNYLHTNVVWTGSSSPYPCPQGEWDCIFIKNHKKFGECFYVRCTKEDEIFIHFGKEKSYGCFLIYPDVSGLRFFEILKQFKDELYILNFISDIRNPLEKEEIKIPIEWAYFYE